MNHYTHYDQLNRPIKTKITTFIRIRDGQGNITHEEEKTVVEEHFYPHPVNRDAQYVPGSVRWVNG